MLNIILVIKSAIKFKKPNENRVDLIREVQVRCGRGQGRGGVKETR